jgi:hypothetical protein
MSFKSLTEVLETKIQDSSQNDVTPSEAERLASEFLHALLRTSAELRKADLDARTRKSGVKALRAALYLDIVQKNEKKPTEAMIAAMLDTNTMIADQQAALDEAEVVRDELERVNDVFTHAHVFFRGVAKGSTL